MSKLNLRAVPVKSTVLGCIEAGYSDLAELQNECQEIVDNASEGLSETQRIQTLSETADALYGADSQPDVPEFLQDIEVTYTEDQRKSKSHSRAARCGEACVYLSPAIAGIEGWVEEQDEPSDEVTRDQIQEAEELISELQELLDAAQGCEFPGMYG